MAVEIVFTTNWRNRSSTSGNVWLSGYPAFMQDTPCVWGSRVTLPRFVIVRITDAKYGDVQGMISSVFNGNSLIQSWYQNINWEVVNNNLSIDGWRLRLYSTNPGLTNKGQVIKEKVENFINMWNGNVVTFGTNSVTFDATIYNAITSTLFWENRVNNVNFSELNYIQAGGMHRVQADYSSLNIKPLYVENKALRRGAEIISHSNKIIVMDITRSDILTVFKKSIKFYTEREIYRRQFRIPESTIDNIISQGGVVEVMLAQLQGYLINRLDENL